MTTGKSMDNSFLSNSKTVKTSSDKRTQTVTWDCTPGYVKYNFRVPCNGGYGTIQRKGRFQGDGIYHWNSSKKAYERAGNRHYLFEGVKCVKIAYRKNNGKWTTKSNSNGLSGNDLKLILTSSKDNDEYEVKATYEIWTQGYPFRSVPFMRFSNGKTSTRYSGGNFKDKKPDNPGRVWSGIQCFEKDTTNSKAGNDLNSKWNLEEVSWTQPNSTSMKTNWTYIDANGLPEKDKSYNKGSWVYGTCQTFKDGMSYVDPDKGWTNISGQKPMKNRKNMWWRYSRTYTSSHSVSVKEPPLIENPKISIKVLDNLTVADSDNNFNGIKGKVKITYTQPQKKAGKYDLFAYQIKDGKITKTQVISNEDISNNETDTVEISFPSFDLKRSAKIVYYAIAKTEDVGYKKTRYGYSTITSLPTTVGPAQIDLLLKSGSHYFNDEPLYSDSFTIGDSVDRSENIQLSWNAVTDPDNHDVRYDIYLCRDANKYAPIGEEQLRVKNSTSYALKEISYHKKVTVNSVSHLLDVTDCDYGEKVNIYVVPRDKYYNDYYYANNIATTVDKDLAVDLEIVDNMEIKDSRGLLCGDRGTIKLKYSHKKNKAATINVYAYIATKNNEETEDGTYANLVWSMNTAVTPGSYVKEIEFKNFVNLKRSRLIKYYAVATDVDGIKSRIPLSYNNNGMWKYAKGFHYYNGIPTYVDVFLTEDGDHAFDDDIIDIAWPQATDPDDHTVYYKLYIQADNQAGDISTSLNKYKDTFYVGKDATPTVRNYAKVIDLGSGILPNNDNPYKLPVRDYIGKNVYIWMVTYDKYNADCYLSGSRLNFTNPGVKPNVPIVEVEPFYSNNMYGQDKIDSENGYVRITHIHPMGRSATVTLHAICSNLLNGTKKVFKNIRSWNLTSGSTTGLQKINFIDKFGEDWRSSEIRYYATAMTSYGEYSEETGWEPTVSMWDKWAGSHKFNDEPKNAVLTLNDEKTDLHKYAVIEWPIVQDPDDTTPVTYSVAFAVASDLRKDEVFYFGSDKTNDEIRKVTEIFDTPNNTLKIDLTEYDEGEQFKVWVVAHDDYSNSYYYTSNTIEFTKATYGPPKITYELNQNHSEHGTLAITYDHTDVQKTENGYVSLDPDRSVTNGDFNGTVNIYCYINDLYTVNYSIIGESFTLGQTKEYDIPFDKVSPEFRTCAIRYLIVAVDNNPGMKNVTVEPEEANAIHLTDSYHYYNDEPYDTQINVGEMDKEEDKYIYNFDYVNLVWDSPYEPDDDSIIYYMYVNTPISMAETKQQYTIKSRTQHHTFDYTRKYRIREKYNSLTDDMGCEVFSFKNNEWIKIQDNSFVGYRLDFLKDDIGNEWPINEEFKIHLECRDHRNWDNSYYGYSEFTGLRKKHEPPNDVKIEVIPNLPDDGDGEHGKIKVIYTHPEGDIDGIVDIYAYQDGIYKGHVHSATYKNNIEQIAEINFTNYEKKDDENDPAKQLLRSKNISYFAKATDTLVSMTSLDKYPNLTVETIPPTATEGPVQVGAHYFNEEPPSTSPEEYNKELITYTAAEIKWNHVIDPDGHNVNYEIYVASSDEGINTEVGEFYNDDQVDNPEVIVDESSENGEVDVIVKNSRIPASGTMLYNKKVSIPASLAELSSKQFSVSTAEYSEDSNISLWIVSKDQYKNSYYRAGDMLTLNKGHKARNIREVYPRNNSTIYAQTPRILIYLGEDNQKQTTYVGWKEQVYNNKEHPQYFSDIPNNKNVIVFRPPVPYTTLHDTKVSFYVYSHNQSTYSEKKYITYTYKNFFEEFVDDKLIPLKSLHINEFRKCCNILRDAYGLETLKFTREIKRNQIFENFDFNETKKSLTDINDLLNNADPTPNQDYVNNLIVDINDLDVVEYKGEIETSTYEEFLEWGRLLCLLEDNPLIESNKIILNHNLDTKNLNIIADNNNKISYDDTSKNMTLNFPNEINYDVNSKNLTIK